MSEVSTGTNMNYTVEYVELKKGKEMI